MEDKNGDEFPMGPTDGSSNGEPAHGERADGLSSADGEPMIGLTVSEYDQLKADLDSARLEAEKHLDTAQRALADYNNLRRRTEQEREQMRGDLTGRILNPFLDVLDDLDLAVRNRPAGGAESGWGEGIELVYRKLLGRLEAAGVTRMEVDGREFDPHFHEAITHEESDDFESGRIIAVVKPGYVIGDRVLRPAMVRVAA